MPRNRIERIRKKMRKRQFDLSAHAMEEMAEDRLDIEDVECAILNGKLISIQKGDPRGMKYVIQGSAVDGETHIGVVGRFSSVDRYVIITVYQITDPEE